MLQAPLWDPLQLEAGSFHTCSRATKTPSCCFTLLADTEFTAPTLYINNPTNFSKPYRLSCTLVINLQDAFKESCSEFKLNLLNYPFSCPLLPGLNQWKLLIGDVPHSNRRETVHEVNWITKSLKRLIIICNDLSQNPSLYITEISSCQHY